MLDRNKSFLPQTKRSILIVTTKRVVYLEFFHAQAFQAIPGAILVEFTNDPSHCKYRCQASFVEFEYQIAT